MPCTTSIFCRFINQQSTIRTFSFITRNLCSGQMLLLIVFFFQKLLNNYLKYRQLPHFKPRPALLAPHCLTELPLTRNRFVFSNFCSHDDPYGLLIKYTKSLVSPTIEIQSSLVAVCRSKLVRVACSLLNVSRRLQFFFVALLK